jgi:Protein of unknown function (DUF4238)
MDYPKVKHSHIIPAGYLRAWSLSGRVAMRLAGSQESLVVGVKDAGVRSDFYRRERPSGEAIYDVEWSLAEAESVAIPVVRALGERWPPTSEDKSKVAQFFALQHVRGPVFRRWHEDHVAQIAAELRTEPSKFANPQSSLSPEQAIEEYIARLKSSTYRLTRMLSLVRSVSSLLGSMHWALVGFEKGRLSTSDHPVVVWPASRGRVRPRSNDLQEGLADSLEIFVPTSPEHLLLMTWGAGQDRDAIIAGKGAHIATASAFVAANAEKQWFHVPGEAPWLASGERKPLSRGLLPRYRPDDPSAHGRRIEAVQLAKSLVGKPPSNDPIPMLRPD